MDYSQTYKDLIRQRVWPALREVAIPDSRFHYDFGSFIADFDGSSAATKRLLSHPAFVSAKTVFITPDNCLRELRYAALSAAKLVLVTTSVSPKHVSVWPEASLGIKSLSPETCSSGQVLTRPAGFSDYDTYSDKLIDMLSAAASLCLTQPQSTPSPCAFRHRISTAWKNPLLKPSPSP